MVGDLKRWWVHTLTDHLVFSFQANVFIPGNKQDAVRGVEIQGELGKRDYRILVLGSLLFPGSGGHLPSLKHNGLDASTCPQMAIFIGAPGGRLFTQEPGWALSVGYDTKALIHTLLSRLITNYLK